MKRPRLFPAPPLVCVLAAVLVWLTGAHARNTPRSANPRKISAVLDQLEQEILINPPAEIHDAKGMEAALDSDDLTGSFCGGGQSASQYADEWVAESPEAMFAWLVNRGGSSFRRSLSPACDLFRTWAEKDMAAALAAVSRIPDRNLRRQALLSSVEILCKSDPGRARDLMIQNLGLFSPGGPSLIFRPYETGKAIWDMLWSLPPGAERTHLLANLLTDMALVTTDPPGQAEAAWQQCPADLRRELVAAGFTTYGGRETPIDGLEELMRERAEKSGDRAAAEQFINAHGPAWAKRDLPAALAWTRAHLKGKSRVERSAELFEYLAAQDFKSVLRLWQTLPDSSLKVRAAYAISKGTPSHRRDEVDGILKSSSERDRPKER